MLCRKAQGAVFQALDSLQVLLAIFSRPHCASPHVANTDLEQQTIVGHAMERLMYTILVVKSAAGLRFPAMALHAGAGYLLAEALAQVLVSPLLGRSVCINRGRRELPCLSLTCVLTSCLEHFF